MSVSIRNRNKHQRNRAPRQMTDELLFRWSTSNPFTRLASGLQQQARILGGQPSAYGTRALVDEAYSGATD